MDGRVESLAYAQKNVQCAQIFVHIGDRRRWLVGPNYKMLALAER